MLLVVMYSIGMIVPVLNEAKFKWLKVNNVFNTSI